ncbi:5-formyltetrahydrofolate cyclo-ligase [Roseomonas elaeocarpi]|uniref:5-formyltetrahydrofolate cyclo-ligase n=1 Tax=Roseomonas elaeocarpi TaxID=907779 RepID=A0ABV6JRU9_9PROT
MVAPHPIPSDPEDVAARKRSMRRSLLARRATIPTEGAAEAAWAQLLASGLVPAGAVVSAYWPLGHELDPRPAMLGLLALGHTVILPVTAARGQPLTFRQWDPAVPLRDATFGLREPPPEAPERRPDLLLVPLLGFDRRGHRLGYGAGYYDRTLESLPGATALGFAFAEQEVAEVPTGPGDRPLHAIVTERGLISVAAPS